MTVLASDSDLRVWQWNPTYPLVLLAIWGVARGCKIEIAALNPSSSDAFPRIMIAQRAALIVSRCVDNIGGTVSVGPRGQFQVQVFADVYQATV